MNRTKTIIASVAVIIIFIIIVITNHIYVENDYFEKWLICEYQSDYSNYKETLNFVFVSDILYKFYREETFEATEEHSLDEIYSYFLEQKESLKEQEQTNFTYEVKKSSDKINITTYIKALSLIDFYNEYIEEKDLDFDDTIDEIMYDLEEEYVCKVEKR